MSRPPYQNFRPTRREPARIGRMVVVAPKPAHRAGRRQSLLAGDFRDGPGEERATISAGPASRPRSRAARLAGGRVPRLQLGHQAVLQTDGHVSDVPAGSSDDARKSRHRSGKSPPVAGVRCRLDAEEIRDQALAASGLLTRKIGGPGVRPYQPPNIWDVVGLPEGNTRSTFRIMARTFIGEASTPSGSGQRRRRRWSFSMRRCASRARSTAT